MDGKWREMEGNGESRVSWQPIGIVALDGRFKFPGSDLLVGSDWLEQG